MSKPVEIKLLGHIPSKKNEWRIRWRRNGRGVYIGLNESARRQIDALTLQVQAQWVGRTPLEHPEIIFRFGVRSRRPDRDNIMQTLLDILVLTRVLKQDNIAHCNGPILIEPAEISREWEWASIVLTPTERRSQ